MRPKHTRTPKADLVPIVEELTAVWGLGDRSVGAMLGYSPRYINEIKREFGIAPNGRPCQIDIIRRMLPSPLRDKVQAIYARSVVSAHDCPAETSALMRAHLARAKRETVE